MTGLLIDQQVLLSVFFVPRYMGLVGRCVPFPGD